MIRSKTWMAFMAIVGTILCRGFSKETATGISTNSLSTEQSVVRRLHEHRSGIERILREEESSALRFLKDSKPGEPRYREKDAGNPTAFGKFHRTESDEKCKTSDAHNEKSIDDEMVSVHEFNHKSTAVQSSFNGPNNQAAEDVKRKATDVYGTGKIGKNFHEKMLILQTESIADFLIKSQEMNREKMDESRNVLPTVPENMNPAISHSNVPSSGRETKTQQITSFKGDSGKEEFDSRKYLGTGRATSLVTVPSSSLSPEADSSSFESGKDDRYNIDEIPSWNEESRIENSTETVGTELEERRDLLQISSNILNLPVPVDPPVTESSTNSESVGKKIRDVIDSKNPRFHSESSNISAFVIYAEVSTAKTKEIVGNSSMSIILLEGSNNKEGQASKTTKNQQETVTTTTSANFALEEIRITTEETRNIETEGELSANNGNTIRESGLFAKSVVSMKRHNEIPTKTHSVKNLESKDWKDARSQLVATLTDEYLQKRRSKRLKSSIVPSFVDSTSGSPETLPSSHRPTAIESDERQVSTNVQNSSIESTAIAIQEDNQPRQTIPGDPPLPSTKTETSGSFEDITEPVGNSQTGEVYHSTTEWNIPNGSVLPRMESGQSSSERNNSDNSTRSSSQHQWPVKHSVVVEGDLVIGGLMMVHEREDSVTCGPVMPQGGVQALEAMLFTLDRVNQQGIIPGVKIGTHILDDCDKDTYGLEMAVDFIKGSISNIDGAEYHCNKTAVRKVISGVVGAASSVTSIQVANLLRLFRIPQVSFFSTSPELSNKQRFEYFTRTIPSDHYQVKAMVDIVRKMGWSYVSIIYEESNYGIKAFEELEELLAKYKICIAIKEKLVKDSGVAEETAYDNIVLKLLTKPRARGCIIFGSDQEVAGVMRAVRRCNATGAFSWIGSDGWSARGLVSNGNEPEVEGTLSVQPQANPVNGFHEYFLNLTVENNKRNPWFVEFWEDHFQCRYPNSSWTPYNQKYTLPCTTKERLTKQNTAFEDQLQFVSDAVMAFAYAFRDMHRDLCGGKSGLCDAMKPTKGTELLKYLRKVDFVGISGDRFRFDKNGDGPARYNIIHFKQTSPGKYKWIRVGKYLDGELRLNMSEIQFKMGHPQPPESVCSLPCEVGQAKKYVESESCCWHCFNCTHYQIRDPSDETQCYSCPPGTIPDETHSHCNPIPEEFLRPESGWAIGAMSLSATGILMTLFVGLVFLKHNDTPIVRASGRELSYVLLTGILLCYLVTFALVLKPTNFVCSIQRFAAGFCFTVVYAALLTKTNRISRIFNAGKQSAKRPSFISPRSQLIICSALVSVQILINGVWMIIDPAKAIHHYPTREDNLLVCNSYIDASYMIVFTYPIILILVCTIYAILTRKIPEAFNESKHIGFTMYTTCVIWFAFVPLYFGTVNHVALRITSMSVTISLSASVTIACLFSPKLYIILIRPERNIRQSMMQGRYSTTKSSAVTNASGMLAPVSLTAVTCDQSKAVKRQVVTTIDCSTQSEYYELELREQKNGKPVAKFASRCTQTMLNNNEKDRGTISTTEVIEINKDGGNTKESPVITNKQINNQSSAPINRIGNGPVNNQNNMVSSL